QKYYYHDFVFEADSGANVGLYCSGVLNGTGTRFMAINGFGDLSTEALSQTKMRAAGTVQYCSVVRSTAGGTIGATWTLRKNGANTAISIVTANNTTGRWEDATNSVSFVSGDLLNWQAAGQTGTQSGTEQAYATITWSGADIEVFFCTHSFSSSDQYYCLHGTSGVSGNTTESTAYTQHGYAGTISKYRSCC